MPIAAIAIAMACGMLVVGIEMLDNYISPSYSGARGTFGIMASAVASVFEVVGFFLIGWFLSLIPVYFAAHKIAPNRKRKTAIITTIAVGVAPILLIAGFIGWINLLAFME